MEQVTDQGLGSTVVDPTSSFIDELFESINQEEAAELKIEDPQQQGFSIQNKSQANYFIRKLKQIRSEKEDATKQSQEALDMYTAKVQKFLESVYTPLDSQEQFIYSALHEFALKERQTEPSKKTFKMIEGTLAFRAQQPQYEYDDEALKEFLEKDTTLKDDYLKAKTTYSPDKTKIKTDGTVDKTGQLLLKNKVVTGITVTKRPDKFEVK